ncbi:MAG: DUF5671 domain-containing protein [Candidatus Pacebacteria bacterium]|nr:DUF5671 domain-containing protein [Candidatus Paceibacterota bacterium]
MNIQTSKQTLNPKFFFISLGVLVTLVTSVSSFLILFFEALNKKFPDSLNGNYLYGYHSYNFETIRAALATLIIFFPVFLVLTYLWSRELNKDIGRINEIIHKWMVYLILFLASLVIVIDLVTLVRYFVSGEITNRFVFKIIGTLVVASLVDFYYYLKMKNNKKFKKLELLCGVISIIFVFGLIVGSFSVMGSPAKQRAWRLDERRINDLQGMEWQIINFWQQKERLPETLAELSNPVSNYMIPVEPEFEKGRAYEYLPSTKEGELSFDLCATFSAEMPKGWQEGGYGRMMSVSPVAVKDDIAISSTYPYGGINNSWDHGVGRTCFNRIIDKELYPPFEKEKGIINN